MASVSYVPQTYLPRKSIKQPNRYIASRPACTGIRNVLPRRARQDSTVEHQKAKQDLRSHAFLQKICTGNASYLKVMPTWNSYQCSAVTCPREIENEICETSIGTAALPALIICVLRNTTYVLQRFCLAFFCQDVSCSSLLASSLVEAVLGTFSLFANSI